MKKVLILIVVLFFIGIAFVAYKSLSDKANPDTEVACTLDAKVCPDGTLVGRVGPNCEFAPCPSYSEDIKVTDPSTNEVIESPVIITGEAKGAWYFEAVFNTILYDDKGLELGSAILTAKTDWMSEDFVPFEGTLSFKKPTTSSGTLRFLSANPSGLPQNLKTFDMPVRFTQAEVRNVLLYYYDPEKDKDQTGNIMCSREGLVAVEREIPLTLTPIKDTIELLLEGSANLTQSDVDAGVTTEFPLQGFSLTSANLGQGGNLVLRFDDPQNKTSGGACRVGVLWFQIEATAKQFTEVKSVEFVPEELFQP